MDKFRNEQKQLREQNKKYDELKAEIKGFTADLLSADRDAMKQDTSRLNREVKWTKNLQKDNYVFEASNVVNDMEIGVSKK